ncbi:MAG: lasso RiPP family leader peptide-containing protein [Chloroflexi bacterium]|nr:lasso RiPP family leader peptide-containing protein [Chloroflexota bacterium]MBI4504518.1 lasso RiPP family leader peptide-containing protein [Chloroflexota bacterium]
MKYEQPLLLEHGALRDVTGTGVKYLKEKLEKDIKDVKEKLESDKVLF